MCNTTAHPITPLSFSLLPFLLDSSVNNDTSIHPYPHPVPSSIRFLSDCNSNACRCPFPLPWQRVFRRCYVLQREHPCVHSLFAWGLLNPVPLCLHGSFCSSTFLSESVIVFYNINSHVFVHHSKTESVAFLTPTCGPYSPAVSVLYFTAWHSSKEMRLRAREDLSFVVFNYVCHELRHLQPVHLWIWALLRMHFKVQVGHQNKAGVCVWEREREIQWERNREREKGGGYTLCSFAYTFIDILACMCLLLWDLVENKPQCRSLASSIVCCRLGCRLGKSICELAIALSLPKKRKTCRCYA